MNRDCNILLVLFVPGADIRSVCTEAGMYAIRARRKTVTEKDFLDAVNKVIKGYQKFSATPKYMVYNWLGLFLAFDGGDKRHWQEQGAFFDHEKCLGYGLEDAGSDVTCAF